MSVNKIDKKYILQSVDNALSIIDLLSKKDFLSITQITDELDIGKSTVFRLLATLMNKGFVNKDNNSKYSLGIKFSVIGDLLKNRSTLITQIHPYLDNISSIVGETSHLVIWKSDIEVVFVDKVIGSSSFSMKSMVGFTKIAHLTATGKALLAYCSKDFINQYISKVSFVQQTQHSIKNKSSLLNILEEIKLNGFACDNEESEEGLTCFAVPIICMNESVAAISVSGATFKMETKKQNIILLLKEAASEISNII